jgi:hypothetical protein
MSTLLQHEYKINIDPRILELLGPSLYTNIYYVLAELIANAYDANASNVYIIEAKDSIIVEDDGTGMSYDSGDIAKYLNVAVETRVDKKDVYVSGSKTRKRMGRKGVGKLSALSVSENVLVITRKNREKSGFILSRHVSDDYKLKPLSEDQIKFERISSNKDGTSIVMTKPQYGLHKTTTAIKNNLIKIFPLVNSDFKIHISNSESSITIDNFNEEMIKGLGGLIILGKEYFNLAKHFESDFSDRARKKEMLQLENTVIIPINLKKKNGNKSNYDMTIKGWIGFYRTTRDRKKDRNDFPDNFISLISNGKLGEYNILSTVGKNKLTEVYIVGQLHVDLFEETELPDMSLSNRQGYKTDDPRYEAVIKYVRDDLLPRIVNMRIAFASYKNEEKNKAKEIQKMKDEEELRKKVDVYRDKTSSSVATKLERLKDKTAGNIKGIVQTEINNFLPIVGLKNKVDSQKKKILISHSRTDKSLADIIQKLLGFNSVPDEDIIYTSSDNVDCDIPAGANIFEYLRDYFVDSYSDKKIFVIYVTSDEMSKNWFPVTEVGAGWITQSKHEIFNIYNHKPQRPLDTDLQWQTSTKKDENIMMTKDQFNKFIKKILYICTYLGYTPKNKVSNEAELKKYVVLS